MKMLAQNGNSWLSTQLPTIGGYLTVTDSKNNQVGSAGLRFSSDNLFPHNSGAYCIEGSSYSSYGSGKTPCEIYITNNNLPIAGVFIAPASTATATLTSPATYTVQLACPYPTSFVTSSDLRLQTFGSYFTSANSPNNGMGDGTGNNVGNISWISDNNGPYSSLTITFGYYQ
jgi:hypothetical protein